MENQEFNYIICFQEEAKEDLKEIIAYYKETAGNEVANSNLDRILNSIDGLSLFPNRCPLCHFSSEIRKLVVIGLPYLVFFKVIENRVYILNIFHSKRNPRWIIQNLENS